MRLLILTASFWAIVAAKPETYKEKEDFQFSRSSSDDGTKSGYYGAQRGNMGGNYERAHNMDSLAQHQLSTLVKQVDGELGEGANTRTGSAFTAANSRGIYGSGNYDLSNLKGRNFAEGTNYYDSQSQSSMARNSGFSDFGHLYSTDNIARYSGSQAQGSARSSGYQTGSHHQTSQYQQTDKQKAADSTYTVDNYEHDSQVDNKYKYNAQSGSLAHASYDHSNINTGSGYDYKTHALYATPVRVYIRPGTRVAIPVSAQAYDASSSSRQNQNAINSDAEVLTNGQGLSFQPTNDAKRYESSYSYRKEWEKHNTIPSTLSSTDSLPKNSELYEDAQLSQAGSNLYESDLNSANSQSRNTNSAYSSGYSANTKTASSSQSRHQAQTYDSGSSTSNAYALNAYNREAAANLIGSHTSDATATSENLYKDAKPKSYQSSFSYHKSWERRGDPYVITPVGDASKLKPHTIPNTFTSTENPLAKNSELYENGQSSQTASNLYGSDLSSANSQSRNTNSAYLSGYSANTKTASSSQSRHQAQRYNSGASALNTYALNSNNREAAANLLGSHISDAAANSENIYEDAKPKSYQSSFSYHKSWERRGDPYVITPVGGDASKKVSQRLTAASANQYSSHQYDCKYCIENRKKRSINDGQGELGQLSENTWESLGPIGQHMQKNGDQMQNFGQETHYKWDDSGNLGQQTQDKWDNLENLGQQTQNQWDNFQELGQQTQNQWGSLDDLGQQIQSQDKLEDLGQQTQNEWKKIQDLGQQTQDKLEDLGQQTQNQWSKIETLSQQPQTQDKLEELGQHTQNQWGKLEDLGQQTQNQWNQLEDLGQQTQNQWNQLEDLGQQTQNQWGKLEDLGQQTQSQWNNLEDLGQQTQNHWDNLGQQTQGKLEELGQQTQNQWNQLEDLGQQTQNQWGKLEDLGQQTQSQRNNLEDLGQQTQNHWDNLGQQTQGKLEELSPQTQNQWNQLEDLGQQTQNQWGKLEDLGQQIQSQWNNLEDLGQLTQNHWNTLGQQTQGKLEDLGQQTQNQWNTIEDLSQQPQTQDKLEDLAQQTQSQWDNLGDLTHTIPQSHWGILEGQQTQIQDKLEDLRRQWDDLQQQWSKLDSLDQHEKILDQQSQSENRKTFQQETKFSENSYGEFQSWNTDRIYPYFKNTWEIPDLANNSAKNKTDSTETTQNNISVTIHKNLSEKPQGNTTENSNNYQINEKERKLETLHEINTTEEVRPNPQSTTDIDTKHLIDIGRGDIGPEDTSNESTSYDEKTNYKTPKEIESVSLTKEISQQNERKIFEEPLNMSVTGLNLQNKPINKKNQKDELSTIVESVTTLTTKPKNSFYNNMNIISNVQESTSNLPKSEKMPVSVEQQVKIQIDTLKEPNLGQQLQNVEQQNWAQESQNFVEQQTGQQFFEDQSSNQYLEPFEVQNTGQHLEPIGKELEYTGKKNVVGLEDFNKQINTEKNSNMENFKEEIETKDQNDVDISIPIEASTEKPGFWSSVWKKTKDAKNSVVSWFHR